MQGPLLSRKDWFYFEGGGYRAFEAYDCLQPVFFLENLKKKKKSGVLS